MKTLRKVPLSVIFTDEIDINDLAPDTVYIRQEKMYFTHLCLCDCKRLVNLPINILSVDRESSQKHSEGWNVTVNDGKVTITPSILNHPCECHYIVTNGIANIV